MRAPRPNASGCWRSSGRSTAGRWPCGLARRWPPSTWRAKTASRCITIRCGGGWSRRDCGAAPANAPRIASAGSARRISASWCTAGPLYGLEERLCPGGECGGAGHRGRAVDAVWPHVRGVGDPDPRRALAAGEGPRRAESWDAPGSPREEIAPLGDRGRRRGECVPGNDVSARAQRPLRAAASLVGGLPPADARVASRSIACCSSRRHGCCPTTGWCATTRGTCKWPGKVSRRPPGARCWSGRRSPARSRFAIAVA